MEVDNENSENFKSSKFCDDVQSNIIHLLNKDGNKQCVDCNSADVTHINCMLGVFICSSCAKFHQGLGPGLNRVLPIDSKKITNEDVRILTTIGNKGSRDAYEKRLPLCYKRPTHNDPTVFMEEWMKAKYDRKEFTEGMPWPSYLQNTKDGILWKRGKDNRQFKLRRFVLCKQTKTLKYFVKDGPNTTPKAMLNLDTIDAFVAPEKIGNPNGMQIIFEDKGSTRSLFVYAETSEELISWYTAIYAAKLQWLRIAFPCTPDDELCKRLWPRIVKEGWLRKCGPEKTDRFHNRWVTLFNRKMIYSLDSLDPFPRGEVVIGSFESKLYWIKIPDDPDYSENKGAIFLLGTPGRVYTFMAETEQERKEWVESISTIIGTPLLPFEQKELAKRKSKGISKRISNLFVS